MNQNWQKNLSETSNISVFAMQDGWPAGWTKPTDDIDLHVTHGSKTYYTVCCFHVYEQYD